MGLVTLVYQCKGNTDILWRQKLQWPRNCRPRWCSCTRPLSYGSLRFWGSLDIFTNHIYKWFLQSSIERKVCPSLFRCFGLSVLILQYVRWVWRKWSGPKQLQDKKTQSLMMLPTDYVLVTDKSFKKYVKAYAEDQDVFFKEYVELWHLNS